MLYYFLENAKSFPSCDLIEKLSEALNTDILELFKSDVNFSRSELESKIVDSIKLLDDKNVRLLYEITKSMNSSIL